MSIHFQPSLLPLNQISIYVHIHLTRFTCRSKTDFRLDKLSCHQNSFGSFSNLFSFPLTRFPSRSISTQADFQVDQLPNHPNLPQPNRLTRFTFQLYPINLICPQPDSQVDPCPILEVSVQIHFQKFFPISQMSM